MTDPETEQLLQELASCREKFVHTLELLIKGIHQDLMPYIMGLAEEHLSGPFTVRRDAGEERIQLGISGDSRQLTLGLERGKANKQWALPLHAYTVAEARVLGELMPLIISMTKELKEKVLEELRQKKEFYDQFNRTYQVDRVLEEL